jgi:hypothetical protein
METALRTLGTLAAIIDTAADIIERAHMDGIPLDDIGSTHDVARSICERIVKRSEREARALHTMFHGNATTGDTDKPSPVPDVMTRARARTRKVRTNSGASVDMVTLHGRAHVIGSTAVQPHREHSMSAQRATAMLDDTARTITGRDALDVYRATQALYGASIPALIGADVLAFHEWQDTGSSRHGEYRPVRYPTRYRIATPRPRTGELSQPRSTAVDWSALDVPSWEPTTVRELLAGTGDRDTVFVGHRRITRTLSYRDHRATRARSHDEVLHIPHDADVAHVLASVASSIERGDKYRAPWYLLDEHGRVTDVAGTLTVSASQSYSVRGLPAGQVKARTTEALARGIARALAS